MRKKFIHALALLLGTTVCQVQAFSSAPGTAPSANVLDKSDCTAPNVTTTMGGTTAARTKAACQNSTYRLTVNTPSQGTIEWYDAPVGGNLVGTGTVFFAPVTTTTTIFYATNKVTGCDESATRLDFTLNASRPEVTGVTTYTEDQLFTICVGSSANSIGPGRLAIYEHNGVSSNPEHFLPSELSYSSLFGSPAYGDTLALNIYGATQVSSDICRSMTPVNVRVTYNGYAPVLDTNNTTKVCSSTPFTLGATKPGTGILYWSKNTDMAPTLASGNNPTLTPDLFSSTTNVDYYVMNVENGCKSTPVKITVEVNTLPTPPSFNAANSDNRIACTPGDIKLVLDSRPPTHQELRWFISATSTTPFHIGDTYTHNMVVDSSDLHTAQSVSFFTDVRQISTGCTNLIRLEIKTALAPQIPTPVSVFGNPLYMCENTAGTVELQAPIRPAFFHDFSLQSNFSSLLPVNNGRVIDVAANQPDTNYYARTKTTVSITNLPSRTCYSDTAVIRLTRTTQPSILGPTSVCVGATDTIKVSAPGGVFSSLGGAFTLDSASFAINATNTGNSSFTYKIGQCASNSFNIQSNPSPANISFSGNQNLCTGNSTTLSATSIGATDWAWSNGGSTNSITVSPTDTTTYTLTTSNNAGCSRTSSVTVNVFSAPVATISGATTICAGESVTLTGSGGNTQTWGNGLGTGNSISVTPTQTTTYSLTVSAGANCTGSTTHIVTVNPVVQNNIQESICAGSSYTFQSLTLSRDTSFSQTHVSALGCDSVVTFTLNVTPAPVTLIDTTVCNGSSFVFGSHTITQSGNYDNQHSTLLGCDSIVRLKVVVLAPIGHTFSKEICVNETYTFNGQQVDTTGQYQASFTSVWGCDSLVTLNLSVVSEYTSSFSSQICEGDYFIFNGDTLYTPNTYTTTYNSVGGCDSVVTLTLSYTAAPNNGVSLNEFTLTATETNGTYQWVDCNNNNAVISGATARTYSPQVAGEYAVVVTKNGCSQTSVCTEVKGMSIADMNTLGNINVYPNPATTYITIDNIPTNTGIRIKDITGKVLFVTQANNNTVTINTGEYANGVYLIELTNGKTQINKKFVLSK